MVDNKIFGLAMHAPENKDLSDEEYIEKLINLGMEGLSVEGYKIIKSKIEANGNRPQNAYVRSSEFVNKLEILWVFMDDQPKPKLAVVIDEKTTMGSIIKASPKIRDLRKALLPLFGSTPAEYERFLLELRDLKNTGVSWKRISKRLNYDGLAIICMAYEEKKQGVKIGMTFAMLPDYFFALGYSMGDYDEWLTDGLDALENDRLPWDLENGPFTSEKIRENVRYMNERINKGLFAEEPFRQVMKGAELSSYILFIGNYYEQANSLLKKFSYDQWKANHKWILEISETIKNKIETGTDVKSRFEAN